MNRIEHGDKLEFLTRAIDAVAEVYIVLKDEREKFVFARSALIYFHEFLIHVRELCNACQQAAVRDKNNAFRSKVQHIKILINQLSNLYERPFKLLRHSLAAHNQVMDKDDRPVNVAELLRAWRDLGEMALLEMLTKARNIYDDFVDLKMVKPFQKWRNDQPILQYVKARIPAAIIANQTIYDSLDKNLTSIQLADKSKSKELRVLTICIQLVIVTSLMKGFNQFRPSDGRFGENAEGDFFLLVFFSVWGLFLIDLCSLMTNLLPSRMPEHSDPSLTYLWTERGHAYGKRLALFLRDCDLEDQITQARNRTFAHLEASESLQSIIERWCKFADDDLDRRSQGYAQDLVRQFYLGCMADPSTKYLAQP